MTAASVRRPRGLRDEELVLAVRDGSMEALGELFERHEPSIRRYLARVGVGRADLDDLVQSVFLEILRAAPRFDPDHAARAWIFGVATVMVRRHRRSLARAAARIVAWVGVARHEAPVTPAEAYEGDVALRRFTEAFTRLSSKKRDVFVLVTLEGLSGEEAAGALDIPVNTVWTRLHGARTELRRAMEDER